MLRMTDDAIDVRQVVKLLCYAISLCLLSLGMSKDNKHRSASSESVGELASSLGT